MSLPLEPVQPQPAVPAKGRRWPVFAVFGALVAIVVVFAIASREDDSPSSSGSGAQTPVPFYRVVEEQGQLIKVWIDVMPPDGATGLQAVFDDVRAKPRNDGGYFVRIDCSSSRGTSTAINRLANGTFAIGPLGVAQTGLDAGNAEFSVNPNRICPE